ncbi:MAG TPA: hypothetical protein VHT28_14705 [Silvibacterium sp.]|jgi:hypothetical protein|nr:hypothetical protein [Silvibacterium sp.]
MKDEGALIQWIAKVTMLDNPAVSKTEMRVDDVMHFAPSFRKGVVVDQANLSFLIVRMNEFEFGSDIALTNHVPHRMYLLFAM